LLLNVRTIDNADLCGCHLFPSAIGLGECIHRPLKHNRLHESWVIACKSTYFLLHSCTQFYLFNVLAGEKWTPCSVVRFGLMETSLIATSAYFALASH
jgi:hypothetical protein